MPDSLVSLVAMLTACSLWFETIGAQRPRQSAVTANSKRRALLLLLRSCCYNDPGAFRAEASGSIAGEFALLDIKSGLERVQRTAADIAKDKIEAFFVRRFCVPVIWRAAPRSTPIDLIHMQRKKKHRECGAARTCPDDLCQARGNARGRRRAVLRTAIRHQPKFPPTVQERHAHSGRQTDGHACCGRLSRVRLRLRSVISLSSCRVRRQAR
jgi:hypothetical protein